MEKSTIRPYESVVLMHPDSTIEEQKALFQKNKSIIESFGGKIHHLDTWGKRYLANPIRRSTKAHYFHVTFWAEPKAIAELERTMKINDKVLRAMNTRLDERIDLVKQVEAFKQSLMDAESRERERENKSQKKPRSRQ